MPTLPAHRFLFVAFLIFVVGVLTLEAVATVGMVLVILGALAAARDQHDGQRALRRWRPLTIFLAWVLLVPLFAGHTPEGAGLGRLADWLALPATAFAFPLLSPKQRRTIAWTAGVVFLASCVVAFLQYERVWPPIEFFRPLAWTKLPFGRAYEPIVGAENHFYGVGLAFHRLKFANVGGLMVVAAFAAALVTTGLDRAMAAVVVLFGLAAIAVATEARSAFASILVALVVMAFTRFGTVRERLLWVGGLCVIVALSLTVSAGLRSRITHAFEASSNGDRAIIWSTVVGVVRSAPVTGIGLGRYKISEQVAHDAPINLREHPGKGHNQFLTLAAETGIPGALLFAWLLGWLAWSFRGAGMEIGRGAMTFFVTVAFTHDPLFHATVSMATVLVFGIALGLSRRAA
jgi:O-antigen ligase